MEEKGVKAEREHRERLKKKGDVRHIKGSVNGMWIHRAEWRGGKKK